MLSDTRVPKFGGTCCYHLQGSQRRVKTEAASTPKKLVHVHQSVRPHIAENAILISTAVTGSISHMYTLHSSSALQIFTESYASYHSKSKCWNAMSILSCPWVRQFVVWEACASHEFRALSMKHGKLNPVGKNDPEFPVDLGFLCDEPPSTSTAHRDRIKWTRHHCWQ